MAFISYAQNFEDVMLWRALKHVDQGFYVDVGANDPEIDSVTKAFYDRGWCGVNIEPVSEWFEKLKKHRTRDINLKVAAGARKGTITFFEIPGTGLSTCSQTLAEYYLMRNYKPRKTKTPTIRLSSICEQYSQADIHFMKIDVEGAEEAVLRGLNLEKFRPWILLIEANLPNSTQESYTKWEERILAANYQFAYSDGLNRFYVAQEHPELLQELRNPPNVFDDFIRSSQLHWELRAQDAESKIKKAEASLVEANERLNKTVLLIQQAETRADQEADKAKKVEAAASDVWMQYQKVINSRSWRMMAPLHRVMDGVKWFVRGSLAWSTLRSGSRPRRAARVVLLHFRNWIVQRPTVKAVALAVLRHFPRIKDLLYRLHYANPTQTVKSTNLFQPDRSRPPTLPENIMTVEELLAKANRLSNNGG